VILPNSDAGITGSLTEIIRSLALAKTINPAFIKDIDDAGTVIIDKNKRYIIYQGNAKYASIGLMEMEE